VNVRYFSKQNVYFIQRELQRIVRVRTKQKIDLQDESALRIIMRGIYLEYSINGDARVDQEVADLDSRVLRVVVSQVVSAMAMRKTYLSDITSLPRPLARGVATSVVGLRGS
jgi:hypothetical protein